MSAASRIAVIDSRNRNIASRWRRRGMRWHIHRTTIKLAGISVTGIARYQQ